MAIRIGDVVVHELIGRGGMAEVWAGVHASGADVAVKVLSAEHAAAPDFRQTVFREIQTTARLVHPSIVLLLGQGIVGTEAEEASGGRLVTGSPYLVMELASTSLDRSLDAGRLGWPEVRTILFRVLDGLAHAHGQGFVHRDLKPENILGFGDPRAPGAWKISDFGLAQSTYVVRAGRAEERATGTPNYMAPEQFQGLFRRFGPWTDLYALGCLAFELVCREPAFVGQTPQELAFKHMTSPPAPFEPVIPVPADFELWIRRLLQKRIQDRFAYASDAAWALAMLGEPIEHDDEALERLRERLRASQPTIPDPLHGLVSLSWIGAAPNARDTDRTGPPPTTFLGGSGAPVEATTESGERLLLEDKPMGRFALRVPLPPSWHDADSGPIDNALVRASLSLFGLRPVPFVGRNAERDRLWTALRDVWENAKPRAVTLLGPQGIGKTRLADWLASQAEETGAAHVLRAHHSPDGGPRDGLVHMLARYLRCVGLTPEDIRQRVSDLLMDYAVDASWELLSVADLLIADVAPASVSDPLPRSGFRGRHGILERLIRLLSVERPVLLVIDDVQWGEDAIAFAQLLLSSEEPSLPVLVVMTAETGALSIRPDESILLDVLHDHERAEPVELGPLSREEQVALVSRMLEVTPALAQDVARRTRGVPLFATQLVGAWVERGMLEWTDRGFDLRPDVDPFVVDDLYAVWRGRLERALDGRPESDRSALELAAVLGTDVDGAEWADACSVRGVAPSEGLVDALVAQGLVRWTATGLSLVHGLLRDTLKRMARERGELVAHHRAAATMLGSRGTYAGGVPERLGRHRLACGAVREAIEPLFVAAEQELANDSFASASEILELRDRALVELDGDRPTADRARGFVLAARIAFRRSDLPQSLRWAGRAERAAETAGDESLLAEARYQLGRAATASGDFDMAADRYRLAEAHYRAAEDRSGLAATLCGRGDLCSYLGRIDEAESSYREARGLVSPEEAPALHATATYGLGYAEHSRGRLDAAAACYARAHDAFVRAGDTDGAMQVLNVVADIHRQRGELEEAERRYRRALSYYESVGSARRFLLRLNLGLVAFEAGDFARAARLVRTALDGLLQTGETRLYSSGYLLLALCDAARNRWTEVDEHLDFADTYREAVEVSDYDDAYALTRIGEMAIAAGHAARARRVLELAQRMWESLGRVADTEKVRLLLKTVAGLE